MIKWVRAKYDHREVEKRAYWTQLEYLFSTGVYNVYKMWGGYYAVIFSDQSELLSTVNKTNLEKHTFLIRFLNEDSNKKSYNVLHGNKVYSVITIANLAVLTPEQEKAIKMTVTRGNGRRMIRDTYDEA